MLLVPSRVERNNVQVYAGHYAISLTIFVPYHNLTVVNPAGTENIDDLLPGNTNQGMDLIE